MKKKTIKRMYRNPEWLLRQTTIAKKSIKALSKECGVSEATIAKYLNEFDVEIPKFEMDSIGKPLWQGYILGRPVIKKNSQTFNAVTHFPTKNPRYQAYVYDAERFVRQQSDKEIQYSGSCIVHFYFYMDSKRAVDISNLYEAPQDVLVKCGIIQDDNARIIVGHDFSRVIYDKDNPRTEIRVYRYDDYKNGVMDELFSYELEHFVKGSKNFFVRNDKVISKGT